MKNPLLPETWKKFRRLLVIRMDNIGDVVMLGPALRTIRENLPDVRISLLASPSGSQVAPMLPWIDEVISWRAVWQNISKDLPLDPQQEWSLIEELRRREFDAAVVFTSFTQSPYPQRLGHSKEFGGSVLSHWFTPPTDDHHQVDRNLSLLEQAGFHLRGRHLELHIPDSDQAAADALLAQAGVSVNQPFILMAPGASCAARRYDMHRTAQVVKGLLEESQLPVIISSSSGEAELLSPVLQMTAETAAISLVGRTNVTRFAGLIRRAALVVANNSSAMHFADAFRRPMVILYSGTELFSQWRPRAAPAHLLREETYCSPCYNFDCPFNMECLDISPWKVIRAGLHLLSQVGLHSSYPDPVTIRPVRPERIFFKNEQ